MKITEIINNCRCALSIAIEGPDSLGKQTQATMLVDRLGASDFVALSVEVPCDDGITYNKIYDMLNDERALKYPATLQGLFIANRLIFQVTRLPHYLMKYDVLVFDRWNGSTYAYGRASGLSEEELLCTLDTVATPDITILLSGTAYAKSEQDTYEKNASLQERVASHYLEWARISQGKTYVIDADDTRDAVHEAIWEVVTTHLEKITRQNVIDIVPLIKARQAAAELLKSINEIEGGDGDDEPTIA